MKIIKGLTVFSVIVGLFGCLSPPEYSNTPAISFKDIYLVEGTKSGGADSLYLIINFKDGDGDVGMDLNVSDSPYNATDYFLADGNGGINEIGTYSKDVNVLVGPGKNPAVQTFKVSPIPIVPKGYKGKLVTNRTRKKAGYGSLPSYPSEYSCRDYDYRFDVLMIPARDTSLFEKPYHIIDTLKLQDSTVYTIQDTLYFRHNPNSDNITIQFLVQQQTNGTYEDFDLMQKYCFNFDSRFPILSDADKSTPLEGTIQYAMGTLLGFNKVFGTKYMKIRVQIKDRSGHSSNVVETDPFTLAGIRR